MRRFLENKSGTKKTAMVKGSRMQTEKRSETLSLTTTPAIRDEIESIAKAEDRSISWVVLALAERGLEAYRKDGFLKPPKSAKLRRA